MAVRNWFGSEPSVPELWGKIGLVHIVGDFDTGDEAVSQPDSAGLLAT